MGVRLESSFHLLISDRLEKPSQLSENGHHYGETRCCRTSRRGEESGKEPVAEPESTTTEEEAVEPEVNGNGKVEEKNGNGHTEEAEAKAEENGHSEETKEEETTLKRKDAPTEVEDSPKKKKLIDSEEKEPEAVTVEA